MSEDDTLIERIEGAFAEVLATPHAERVDLMTDEWLGRYFTPDVEWRSGLFDMDDTFRGYEGTRRFWRRWWEPWRDQTFSYEITRVGTRVVAWIGEQSMIGSGSGMEVRMPPYAWVCSERDGRVSAVEFVVGRKAAEAAAHADS